MAYFPGNFPGQLERTHELLQLIYRTDYFLATSIQRQARMSLAFLATWTCVLMFSQVLTNTPGLLLLNKPSSHSTASLQHCMALLWTKCRTQHLVLLNFIPLVHPAELDGAFSLPGRSTLPPSLVSSADLLKAYSIHSSRSSVKILNRTGSSTPGEHHLWPVTSWILLHSPPPSGLSPPNISLSSKEYVCPSHWLPASSGVCYEKQSLY